MAAKEDGAMKCRYDYEEEEENDRVGYSQWNFWRDIARGMSEWVEYEGSDV